MIRKAGCGPAREAKSLIFRILRRLGLPGHDQNGGNGAFGHAENALHLDHGGGSDAGEFGPEFIGQTRDAGVIKIRGDGVSGSSMRNSKNGWTSKVNGPTNMIIEIICTLR